MAKGSDGLAQAFGYLKGGELPALKNTIRKLPPNSICVNIGAGAGTSGLAFLESSNVGTLYTIDITRESSPFGSLESELLAMKESGFEGDPRHHQICMDSSLAGKAWDKGEVDMVFIDGDHTYEHCKSDIESWMPNLKKGGTIALHDYDGVWWPGVTKAVDEILKPYELVSLSDTFIAFRI